MNFSSIAILKIFTEIIFSEYFNGVYLLAIVNVAFLWLHSPYIFFHLLMEHLVVRRQAQIVIN